MATQSRPLQRPLAVMMRRTLRTISPDATLLEAAQLMRDVKVGALLVHEAGQYRGLVSESDLVRKGMAESHQAQETLVRAVMSRPRLSKESPLTVQGRGVVIAQARQQRSRANKINEHDRQLTTLRLRRTRYHVLPLDRRVDFHWLG